MGPGPETLLSPFHVALEDNHLGRKGQGRKKEHLLHGGRNKV